MITVMKKWIFLSIIPLVILLLIIGITLNKKSRKFDQFSCENMDLMVSDDGKYILSYTSSFADMQVEYFLSAGYVKKDKDILVLTDKENGSSTVLARNSQNDYVVKNGFRDLINQEFHFEKRSDNTSFIEQYRTYHYPMILFWKRKITIDDKLYQLRMGKYKDTFGDFSLVLKSNHEYSYCVEDFVISEGTWKRDKGIVLLRDDVLNNTFTIYIQNSCLVAGFNLPGGMWDLYLRKIED